MSGRDLKATAESAGLNPIEVCGEANVSIATLYKVYNDEHVRATTRSRVENAIQRLSAKAKVVAV